MAILQILVDLDNTLLDIDSAVKRYLTATLQLKIHPDDHRDYWGIVYRVQNHLGLQTREQAAEILFSTNVLEKAHPYPGAKVGLFLLSAIKYGKRPPRLLLITSRPLKQRDFTISQMSQHFPFVAPWQIIMDRNKQNHVMGEGLYVLVDDNPELMQNPTLHERENLLGVIPTHPYNLDIRGKNLVHGGNPSQAITWIFRIPFLITLFVKRH